MNKRTGDDTVNQGSAPRRDGEESGEFEIAGNVREKGEDPSPGDRQRGERSDAESDRRA